jgi:hypothetical protein
MTVYILPSTTVNPGGADGHEVTDVSTTDERDRQRYETLKRQIATVGFLRRGTVVQRWTTCGKATCACQTDPSQRHGPYYQWTRKVKGKTVTVRLPPHQARLFAEWIANARALDALIGQMERLSTRITDRVLRQTDNS